MDYCYRFKQMCKKAETTLKQIPLTGVWPKKLELPVYPDELLKVSKKVNKQVSNIIFLIVNANFRDYFFFVIDSIICNGGSYRR